MTMEEEGSLTIRVEDQQDHIILAYTDDGKGMTEEVLDQIFDPFFTTSRGKGGTGLGMNIVYNLVTQSLNGTIRCSSTLDKEVYLPLQFRKRRKPCNDRTRWVNGPG